MKLTILALTLNERAGVEAILPQLPKWAEVLVVDGGSTDGTVEWCEANGYRVIRQQRKGIRFAYFEALPHCEGDWILTISPDGNCDVSKIAEFLSLGVRFQGAPVPWDSDTLPDLVIGSRYKPPAHSDDDDPITAFGNFVFTLTINLLYGGRLTDAMVIYRMWRKSLFYELGLDLEDAYALPEKLFRTVISIEPLMTVRALKAGKVISEIAAGEPARIGGERKLQILRWGAAYMFQIVRELFFWKPSDAAECLTPKTEKTA